MGTFLFLLLLLLLLLLFFCYSIKGIYSAIPISSPNEGRVEKIGNPPVVVVKLKPGNPVDDRTECTGGEIRAQCLSGPKIAPFPEGGGPLEVRVGIYIESLGSFQSADMSFDMDLYLYLSWRDPSLSHNHTDDVLVNDLRHRERIWLPDLYFANARTSKFHDVTRPNFNLFIARDGTIAYSSRITLTVACNLNLKHYPMDWQTCAIRIVSYAYIEKQVNASWFQLTDGFKPIRYNQEIELPEFYLLDMKHSYCDGTYMYSIMGGSRYKIEKFTCLEVDILLRRSLGYHLVQSFIPTGLIVMISWVSFWIDRRAVPARVTLSFTTLLSLSTIGNGLRFGLPQVSYAKAIDFWFGSCMFFVFMSLIEFAAVNSYMRAAEKYEKMGSSLVRGRSSEVAGGSNFGATTGATPTPPDTPFFRRNNKQASWYLSQEKRNQAVSEAVNILLSTGSTRRNFANNDNGGSKKHVVAKVEDGAIAYDGVLQRRSAMGSYSAATNKDHVPYADNSRCSCELETTEEGREALRASYQRRQIRRQCAEKLEQRYAQLSYHYSAKGLCIDRWSRVLFPALYAGFNLVYWTYYLWYIRRD